MIKILIVEDNDTIREGLQLLINSTEGLNCSTAYRDCESMLEALEIENPDLILMDIGLPGMSGIDGVTEVKKINPEILILILSVYEDNENIFKALCAGACGYLLKRTASAQLIEAIEEAYNGGSPMSSNIARKVVGYFKNNSHISTKPSESDLNERQKQVLSSLSAGNSYKMIADEIHISIDTVRYHIRNIYSKLQVHSQTEAISKAMKKGWIF